MDLGWFLKQKTRSKGHSSLQRLVYFLGYFGWFWGNHRKSFIENSLWDQGKLYFSPWCDLQKRLCFQVGKEFLDHFDLASQKDHGNSPTSKIPLFSGQAGCFISLFFKPGTWAASSGGYSSVDIPGTSVGPANWNHARQYCKKPRKKTLPQHSRLAQKVEKLQRSQCLSS